MKGRSGQVLMAVLILVAMVGALRYWFSEERRIRARLGQVEEYLGKPEGEGDLIGANKARKLGELFTPDFEISIPQYDISVSDRGELVRVALLYRSRAKSATASFSPGEINIDGSGVNATVQVTATLTGNDEGTRRRESYRVAIDWAKDSREGWLIRRLEVLEVLEGNPFL